MTLGLTLPLTEMSATNLLAYRARPERKAKNLTAICDPIYIYKNVTASSFGTSNLRK
jgi:hypothetical protein